MEVTCPPGRLSFRQEMTTVFSWCIGGRGFWWGYVVFSRGHLRTKSQSILPPRCCRVSCEPMAVEGRKSGRYMPTCTRPGCYLCSPYTTPASQEKIQHTPAKSRIYCGGLRNAVRCLVDSYATFCLSLCMLRKVNIPVLTSYSSHAIR